MSDAHTSGYAYQQAEKLKAYYSRFSWRQKVRHQFSEVVLLVVSASIPVAGILMPTDARWAAILGAAATVLVGFRAVFHWRENWDRGSIASSLLETEMRSYAAEVPPYDDPATCDQLLVEKINEIEKAETQGWSSLLKANARQTPDQQPFGTSENPTTPPVWSSAQTPPGLSLAARDSADGQGFLSTVPTPRHKHNR